jgi:tetratricopeptide (TPR) repeat protein
MPGRMQKAKLGIYALLIVLCAVGVLVLRDAPAKAYANVGGIRLARALLRQDSDELSGSLAFLTRALERFPNTPSLERLAARALAETDASATHLLATTDSVTALYAGKALWQAGDREAALKLWQSGSHIDQYFAYTGDSAYGRGDIPLAIEYYKMSNAIADMPSVRKVAMYANLCAWETQQGHPEEAVEWCARAATVQRNVWTLAEWGQALYNAQDYQAARTTLEVARKVDPKVVAVHLRLGMTYEKLGEAELAAESYETGLRLDQKNQWLNMTAGDFFARTGNSQQAYCCYSRVVQYSNTPSLVNRASENMDALASLVSDQDCQVSP